MRVAVRLSGVLAAGALAGILMENTAATSQGPAVGAKEAEPAAASKATEAAAAPKRTAPKPTEPAAGASDAHFEIFLDRLMRAESNGQDDAANPRSTALGPFQFIKSTFIEVARRHFASEVSALDDDAVLALRTNRAFARRAASAFCKDNIAFMIEQELNPTFGHLRLAFLVGPSAAVRLLQAAPTTPVSEILGNAAIAANPFMKGMSAADLIARASRDVGTDHAGPVRSRDARSCPCAQPFQRACCRRCCDLQPEPGQLPALDRAARRQAERSEGDGPQRDAWQAGHGPRRLIPVSVPPRHPGRSDASGRRALLRTGTSGGSTRPTRSRIASLAARLPGRRVGSQTPR